MSIIQKEELWRYVAGRDKRMLTFLWIGYRILLSHIGITLSRCKI
nr:MAG TPA: hypothetical protein [Caudoviricetes sp.]